MFLFTEIEQKPEAFRKAIILEKSILLFKNDFFDNREFNYG